MTLVLFNGPLSFLILSSLSDEIASVDSQTGVQIRVIYPGDMAWSVSYGDESGSQSVDGTGTQIYAFQAP